MKVTIQQLDVGLHPEKGY